MLRNKQDFWYVNQRRENQPLKCRSCDAFVSSSHPPGAVADADVSSSSLTKVSGDAGRAPVTSVEFPASDQGRGRMRLTQSSLVTVVGQD